MDNVLKKLTELVVQFDVWEEDYLTAKIQSPIKKWVPTTKRPNFIVFSGHKGIEIWPNN
jgi:hypothetical protein